MPLLWNATTATLLATRVERADTWLGRFIGLLGRSSLRPEEGVWLESCSAIHTLGMRVPLDVIFVDAENRVLSMKYSVPAWKWAVFDWRARSVIELGAGALRGIDLLPGDELKLQ